MTDEKEPTGDLDQPTPGKKRRAEALPERLLRKLLEGMGDVVDRKFGRTVDPRSGLTTSKLLDHMKQLIDERVRDEGKKGRVAPHHLVLKVEWGTHSEAPPELLNDLKNEVLAAAIDHINDSRYRTLAPVTIETEVDIFTNGISVDPTFGEFEEELKQKDLERQLGKDRAQAAAKAAKVTVPISVRMMLPEGAREMVLEFSPGGRRFNVGRGTDNDIYLNHTSVSKVHAAVRMDKEQNLLVADTGSTNGTHINGQRIAYGEARLIAEGDVVAFGEVEVRFRKTSV